MILRFTQKLADKLKIKSPQDLVIVVNPFEEWYGHLFTSNRVQYILFTNSYSLYSSIIPAKGIITVRDFMDVNFAQLSELLKNDGFENIMEQYITPHTEIVDICKTTNRAVLGSMNDMIINSKFILSEYKLPLKEIAQLLNKTPFSYIKYKTPLRILEQLVNR